MGFCFDAQTAVLGPDSLPGMFAVGEVSGGVHGASN